MSRRAARFTEADAVRAIKAVKRSGERLAVKIDAEGTIWIIPIDPQAPPKPEFDPEREIVL